MENWSKSEGIIGNCGRNETTIAIIAKIASLEMSYYLSRD